MCWPLGSNREAKTLIRLQAMDRTQEQEEDRYGSSEFTCTSALRGFSGRKQGWFATAVSNLHSRIKETPVDEKFLLRFSASFMTSWTVGFILSYFLHKSKTSSSEGIILSIAFTGRVENWRLNSYLLGSKLFKTRAFVFQVNKPSVTSVIFSQKFVIVRREEPRLQYYAITREI